MNLPFDVSRCPGHRISVPFGYSIHKLCAECMRYRSPPKAEYQSYVAPELEDGKCRNFIGEQK